MTPSKILSELFHTKCGAVKLTYQALERPTYDGFEACPALIDLSFKMWSYGSPPERVGSIIIISSYPTSLNGLLDCKAICVSGPETTKLLRSLEL